MPLGPVPWRSHPGAPGDVTKALLGSGEQGPALVPGQVTLGNQGSLPGTPSSKPSGVTEPSEVRDKGSCTAKLQILPQATKFISKKKICQPNAEQQSTSLIKDNKSVNHKTYLKQLQLKIKLDFV